MSLFRALAYLSPLMAGFGIAAALAMTSDKPPKKRAMAAGGVLGAVLVLLLLCSFADSPGQWFPVALLLAAFSILVAGVFLLCESLRAPREVSQIVAGLVVCFLMSTLFWLGPIIRSTADTGATGEAIYNRITWAMGVNPYFTMAYSIFHDDLLHLPFFYKTDLAGFQHDTPRWPRTAAGFLLTGLVLAATAVSVRRVWKKA